MKVLTGNLVLSRTPPFQIQILPPFPTGWVVFLVEGWVLSHALLENLFSLRL